MFKTCNVFLPKSMHFKKSSATKGRERQWCSSVDFQLFVFSFPLNTRKRASETGRWGALRL
jgi:hypothetical protein